MLHAVAALFYLTLCLVSLYNKDVDICRFYCKGTCCMKKRTFRLAAAALALALTGCAAADTSTTAAQIEMRVQDGYIQYYNGTDWENLISTEELKGEKGDKGDKGDPGEKGERGETGPQGAKGDKGDPGTNGINGQNGANGANGKDGANGQNGTNGKNGVDGKNGADGKDGVDGKNGINGKDGLNGKDGVDGKDGRDGIDGKDGRDGIDGKDGKDGVDGKDGRDGVDGKDGASTVPGITREFYVIAYDAYSNSSYWSNSTPYGGHLEINEVNNAFIYQQSTYSDDSSKLNRFNILMNEDGHVNITAIPEPGYSFVKWGDGTTSATRDVVYTDDGNGGLSAYFEPITPPISWDSIKPSEGCTAELTHSYSENEPWIDITYIDRYGEAKAPLGGGLLVDKGENAELGKYISLKHSSTTTIRYGGLSNTSVGDLNKYISGRPFYLTITDAGAYYECPTLHLQFLVDGKVVDPETVLPPLSTVDWLYAKGEAPRPTTP